MEFSIFFLPPPPPPVATLLNRVVANVQYYHATVPSITAEEAITSSLSQHGLYRSKSEARATLRVLHSASGKELTEIRTYLVLDGKPVPADKKVAVPFEVNGAFSRIAEVFFAPERAVCYTFTALPQPTPDGSLQLTFVTSPNLPVSCANHGITLTGLVLLDPTTAQIRHLERTISSPPLAGQRSVTFISIDYAPVTFGDQSVWLPTVFTAELEHGKGRFVAHYSGYHRYTSSATLLPGVDPPDAQPEEAPQEAKPIAPATPPPPSR